MGHLSKAQEFTKRSVDSAIRADRKENGAIWLENSALREAAFGNLKNANQAAAEGLKLMPTSQGVRVEAALAYAMAGDSARAEFLAQDLNKRYPLDTQMQSLWLPAIRAQLALNRKNPTDALKNLQADANDRVWANSICCQPLLSLSDLQSRRGISCGRAGQRGRRRVPENTRPQRHRVELLDRSLGASGRGACECVTVKNLTRR